MMAERRRRIEADQRRQLAAFLHDLPIAVDPDTAVQLWGATRRLAERLRLTVYYAIYLELAQRRHLPLATLDQELSDAAVALAVPILGRVPG